MILTEYIWNGNSSVKIIFNVRCECTVKNILLRVYTQISLSLFKKKNCIIKLSPSYLILLQTFYYFSRLIQDGLQ